MSLCFNTWIIAHDSHRVAKHVQALDEWQEVWQNGPLHTHHDAASRARQLEAWWHHGFQESSVLGLTKTRHLCQQNSIWFSLLRNFTMQQFKMYNILLFLHYICFAFQCLTQRIFTLDKQRTSFCQRKTTVKKHQRLNWQEWNTKNIYTNSPFQSVSWPVLTDVWTSQKHDHKRNHFVPNKLYPLFSSFTMKLIWLKI